MKFSNHKSKLLLLTAFRAAKTIKAAQFYFHSTWHAFEFSKLDISILERMYDKTLIFRGLDGKIVLYSKVFMALQSKILCRKKHVEIVFNF